MSHTKRWKWGAILLLALAIPTVLIWRAVHPPRLQGDALKAFLFAEPEAVNGRDLLYTTDTPEEGKTTYTVLRRDTEAMVSSFTFDSAPAAGRAYYFQVLEPVRETFSADCTQMAATKRFSETGECHAGWLDTEGNFFDVTETLGDGAGDETDGPPAFFAIGFAGAWFGYAQRLSDAVAYLDFYVPVERIKPEAVQPATFSFVPAANGGAPYPPWHVSDWLDGMRRSDR